MNKVIYQTITNSLTTQAHLGLCNYTFVGFIHFF